MQYVSAQQARALLGQPIYAKRKDGSVATGVLVKVDQDRLVLAQLKEDKGKIVQTRAFIPLVLFDLLVIGTLPLWGGGFGGGKGQGCCPPKSYGYVNPGYSGYPGYPVHGYPQQGYNHGYNYGYNGNDYYNGY